MPVEHNDLKATRRSPAESAKAFWNDAFSADDDAAEQPDEGALAALRAAASFFGDVSGKSVLDLGCGSGKASVFFASRGADVLACDTSEVAIENLSRYCARKRITNIRAEVSDALDIRRFGPVDFVFGGFILHHVEPFDQLVDELRATVKPAGSAFFWENNAALKPMMWFRDHFVGRFGIPKMGDAEERPLDVSEIDQLRRAFRIGVEYPELYLVRLVSAYLLRGRLARACAKLDELAFAIRPLRGYSYRQYIYCSNPYV